MNVGGVAIGSRSRRRGAGEEEGEVAVLEMASSCATSLFVIFVIFT